MNVVFAIVCLAIAIPCALLWIWGIKRVLKRGRGVAALHSKGARATGTVIQYSPDGAAGVGSATVDYSFIVDGTEFFGTELVTMPQGTKPGDPVPVTYNPDDPAEHQVSRGFASRSAWWFAGVFVVFGLLAACIVGLVYFAFDSLFIH